MSSSENEEHPPRRSELKKLHFEKSQELKKAKSKADKEAIEAKYRALESELFQSTKKAPELVSPDAIDSFPKALYSEPKELSRAQKKKDSKRAKDEAKRADLIAAVGDGSTEAALATEEMSRILEQLPTGYTLQDIPSDGDCLFASLIAQLDAGISSRDLREMISDYLLANEDEFRFFIDEDISFEDYCSGIRKAAWGSDLELEVVARLLERPVQVYMQDHIVTMGEIFLGSSEPLRVSFHRLQYASPHYNAIVPS